MKRESIGAGIGGTTASVDVSIIMPCLNEAKSLPGCIRNAQEALEELRLRVGLLGEIVVADNGSKDGSRGIARDLGARVIKVAERGYGAALIGGATAARGRYLVMGDADGSYDFRDAVAMVEALAGGADLVMGSRFKGRIKPGAMPWKNRYLGNPVLTGILNLLFKVGISDAHCGLRALTHDCFERLGLHGVGMEFASEMVIKASLKGERIVELPATLSPDLRDRPPHLRPWRDGWRHLRYLLMLSPTWVFAMPAAALGLASMSVLVAAALLTLGGASQEAFFGNYWVILAGAMLGVCHTSALLAVATHLYGVREGYRRPSEWTLKLARWVSLETMLAAGLVALVSGLVVLFFVIGYWSAHRFEPIASVLPAVVGTSLVVIGAQNALGGFLLAIVGGNEASFLTSAIERAELFAAPGKAPLLEARSAPQASLDACVSRGSIAKARGHKQVLMATHYFESHRGGVELVAGRIGRALQHSGLGVTWLAADATPSPQAVGPAWRTVSLAVANTVERRLGVPFPLPKPSALATLWREVRRADILFLHDCLYLTNVAAFMFARMLGKPIVLVQHVGIVPYGNPMLHALMRIANFCIARPMLAAADQVVFISQTTARHFAGLRYRRPPKLIFNGVDTTIFRPLRNDRERKDIRARLGLPPDGSVVLFVGRFVEKKGLHVLERLARLAPQVTFAFAGWGPLSPARWNLANVHVFADLSGASLALLYQASDLFVLPSFGEGLPLALQEALACGLPVICGTDTREADPDLAAFVDGVAVDAADPDRTATDFLAAIEARFREASAGDSAGERFSYVARRYDWSKAVCEYREIIETLADTTAGAQVAPAVTR